MTARALELAGGTDPGCVRKNNEDNFALDPELGLLIVADGMGGHNSGEIASDLAVTTIREFARKMLGGDKNMVPEGAREGLSVRGRQLDYFVRAANTLIYEKGRASAPDAGMGTTVVAALADCRSLTVAHVGDSRLYLWRKGRLEQLTEDHSLVGDQVRRGLIAPEEASKSNLQNVLTRALGAEAEVTVDVSDHPLLPGDVVLLVSDGVCKMLPDPAIARAVAEDPSPARVVSALIEKSRAAGGHDNITVVAARVPSNAGGRFKGFVSKFFGG